MALMLLDSGERVWAPTANASALLAECPRYSSVFARLCDDVLMDCTLAYMREANRSGSRIDCLLVDAVRAEWARRKAPVEPEMHCCRCLAPLSAHDDDVAGEFPTCPQ